MLGLSHVLGGSFFYLAPSALKVPIIVAGRLEGQVSVLGQLFRDLNRLIILLLEGLDEVRSYHKVPFDEERIGSTGAASASRPSNPMDVVLNLERHVVIDHELYIVDVQSSRKDICRD